MSLQKANKDLKRGPYAERVGAWQFGDFTLEPSEGRLARDGQPIAITPKALEALLFLVSRRGHLVTRAEMLDALWPDTYVGDASLTSTIWVIRRALGDGWIETVPKRGYRFSGDARLARIVPERGEPSAPCAAVKSIQAYQLCLQGRHLCHAWPTPAFHRSRTYFERAIRLEPTYAPAHFGLALYHGIGAAMGLLRPVEAWRAFEVSLAAARQLDNSLGENYNGVAAIHLYLHRDWEHAERAFKLALEMDPDDAETRNHYGFSLALFRRTDEALNQIGLAIRLDPLSVRFHWNLAAVFYHSRQYDDAIDQCHRTLDLESTYVHAHVLIGDAYERKGDIESALKHWRLATRRHGGTTVEEFWRAQLKRVVNSMDRGVFVPAMEVARIHARIGNREEATNWLAKALHEPSRLVLELPADPVFDQFRGCPRFDAVVAALPNGGVISTR